MGQPRFLFLSGTGWVSWRLVSANNRELGRSPVVFPDDTVCRVAVTKVRDDAMSLDSRLVLDGGSGQWIWTAHLSGVPVAVSARRYQRERECRYSLTQFLAAVPLATIVEPVEGSGRRRRQLRRSDFLVHQRTVEADDVAQAGGR